MSIEEQTEYEFESYARNISEVFEQDSRRFSRALTEEQEAKA